MRKQIQTLMFLAALSAAFFSTNANAAAPVAVRVSKTARAALATVVEKHPGCTVHAVAATGSMAPTIDDNWIVVMTICDFRRVRPDDVIAYRADDGTEVLHRVTSLVGITGVRVQGDAMQHEDNTLVKPRDYIGTAVAAIHRQTGEIKQL